MIEALIVRLLFHRRGGMTKRETRWIGTNSLPKPMVAPKCVIFIRNVVGIITANGGIGTIIQDTMRQ
jgi:hypothetical protein